MNDNGCCAKSAVPKDNKIYISIATHLNILSILTREMRRINVAMKYLAKQFCSEDHFLTQT